MIRQFSFGSRPSISTLPQQRPVRQSPAPLGPGRQGAAPLGAAGRTPAPMPMKQKGPMMQGRGGMMPMKQKMPMMSQVDASAALPPGQSRLQMQDMMQQTADRPNLGSAMPMMNQPPRPGQPPAGRMPMMQPPQQAPGGQNEVALNEALKRMTYG